MQAEQKRAESHHQIFLPATYVNSHRPLSTFPTNIPQEHDNIVVRVIRPSLRPGPRPPRKQTAPQTPPAQARPQDHQLAPRPGPSRLPSREQKGRPGALPCLRRQASPPTTTTAQDPAAPRRSPAARPRFLRPIAIPSSEEGQETQKGPPVDRQGETAADRESGTVRGGERAEHQTRVETPALGAGAEEEAGGRDETDKVLGEAASQRRAKPGSAGA